MTAVRVSDKGQVTIPAEARKRLGINPRTRLDVEVRGDELVLRPVKSIMDLRGIFSEAAKGRTNDWETIRRETGEAIGKARADENRR